MIGRLLRLGAIATLLLLVAAALVAVWARRSLDTPYRGYAEPSCEVTVEPGETAAHILDRLGRQGVLRHPWLARAYFQARLGSPALKSGEYLFEGPLTPRQVLDKLTRGEIRSHPVTVIEGLTLAETAAALSAAGFGGEEELLAEMRSPQRIADLDPEATDLEGYLLPETYHFGRGTAAREIVDEMVATCRRRIAQLELPAGRTVRELVTLASIVEKEAQLDAERPIIAGVYSNRLARGIGLYADPTIIFALKQLGRWDGNLRRRDLELDSPYNTYRVVGLPPGPICSPGAASLAAAAAPADVPFLYFVSRNDGSHVFASTLAEHNRNVERWQRAYWRERWARERAAKPSVD